VKVIETALQGVLILEPTRYSDERGYFMETFNLKSITGIGLPQTWVQDNLSVSKQNVVRGIHYQVEHAQGKLVRAMTGAVRDVVVDLRGKSKTFGQHVTIDLDPDSGRMVWMPAGCGHGFAVTEGPATFTYKVTDYYCAAGERTILWNDPELGINWGVTEAIVSAKDAAGVPFRAAEVFQELGA